MAAPFNGVIGVQFSSEATTEPITLAEAKEWLLLTNNAQDNLITSLIKVARQQLEKAANISIIQRTVNAVLINQCGGIFLPYQPIISISATVDKDDNDLEIEVLGENVKYISSVFDYAKITYTAGFTTIPEDVKLAVKQQVAHLFTNRGNTELSHMAKMFVAQYYTP